MGEITVTFTTDGYDSSASGSELSSFATRYATVWPIGNVAVGVGLVGSSKTTPGADQLYLILSPSGS